MVNITENLRFSIVVLSFLGLCFVASATSYRVAVYGWDHNPFLIKQALFVMVGIFFMYATRFLSVEGIYRVAPFLFAVCLILLSLTLLPGIGYEVKGSSRWVVVGFRFQPSELLKITYIIYLSSAVCSFKDNPKKLVGRLLIPYFVIAGILLSQPDLGTLVIISVLTLLSLFFVFDKFTFKKFLLLGVLGAGVVVSLIVTSEYRMRRVEAFLSPESDSLGSGYQLVQSFNAIATGDFFGVGWGNSFAVRGYLPEAHTDYIFATVMEQFGLFFSMLLLICIVSVPMILLSLASKLSDLKSSVFVSLVSFLILLEIVINVASAIGLMPPKGLGLPFISYGGSSILAHYILLSLAFLIVDKEPIDN